VLLEHILLLVVITVTVATFVCMVLVGAMMKLEFIWNFSDLMTGMMIIPNTVGLLLLSKVIKEETARYFKW
jgi:AGCS family alanine or glycine:cation symporter